MSTPMHNHPGEKNVVRFILLNAIFAIPCITYLYCEDDKLYSKFTPLQFIFSLLPYFVYGLISIPAQLALIIALPTSIALLIAYPRIRIGGITLLISLALLYYRKTL